MTYLYNIFKYENTVIETNDKINILNKKCENAIISCNDINEQNLEKAFKLIEKNNAHVYSMAMNSHMFNTFLKKNINIDFTCAKLQNCCIGKVLGINIFIYPSIDPNIIYLFADKEHLYINDIIDISHINDKYIACLKIV